MKSALIAASLSALAFTAFPPAAPAAEVARVEIQSGDTLKSLLARQTGKPVKLRLKNGEELGGVVALVGDHLVHLSELSGKEFYDAAISLDFIGAVVVRNR